MSHTRHPSSFRPISQPPHSAGKRFNGLRAAIDPSQIPSVVDATLADQAIWSSEPFLSCDTERTIPLSNSDYNVVDQGNSSPRFIRSTTYAVPNSYDLAALCQVPLAVVLQPFAQQRDEEASIPFVDFGADGPPRCEQCRTYVNPWFTWTLGGQRWICNICGQESQVGVEYFSALDRSGRRLDLPNRPELTHGTVDFSVPEEYWAQPPPPRLLPTYYDDPQSSRASQFEFPNAPEPMATLFIIDVSHGAVTSGLVQLVCDNILDTLYNTTGWPSSLPFSNRRVGFMTFDKTLHFYNVSPSLTTAQMLVVSDIDDVFAPLHHGLFVDPVASRSVIESLLRSIPQQFVNVSSVANALGAALRGALASMVGIGGQVVVFNSSLPNAGPGALSARDEVSVLGTDKEKTLFVPQDPSWRDLAEECAEAGIGVNIFLFPTHFIDIASIGIVATVTGGEIFYHPRFFPERDALIFSSELRRLASRETAYNVSLRARVSSGLRVVSYQGSFLAQQNEDIKLGTMDADKAVTMTYEHKSSLDVRKDVYVQCAVLYTSSTGERRVRVLNLALGVASLAHNVYRYADIDATVTVMAKDVVSRMTNESLSDIKESFTERIASLLLAYRRQCAAGTAPTQLILPEAFKLLPVYGLALMKSKCIRGGSISSDVRNNDAHWVTTMGPGSLLSHLYPRMFAIHDLTDFVGVPNPQTGWVPTPSYMRPSYTYMEGHGAYLIDNGELTVLWLGGSVSPQILLDLYGIDNLDELPRTATLPERDTLLSKQVRGIIGVLEWRRGGRVIPFLIARQNMDASEIEFSNMLVEDQNNDAMSYTDYICHVHKLINTALTSNSNIGGSSFWKGW